MSGAVKPNLEAVVESLDRVCVACLAATDQATWTLLHENAPCRAMAGLERDVADHEAGSSCGHPSHRRGSRGRLRSGHEVCMNCGDVVPKDKRRA